MLRRLLSLLDQAYREFVCRRVGHIIDWPAGLELGVGRPVCSRCEAVL